jgi:16S rRNA processing protein RimM
MSEQKKPGTGGPSAPRRTGSAKPRSTTGGSSPKNNSTRPNNSTRGPKRQASAGARPRFARKSNPAGQAAGKPSTAPAEEAILSGPEQPEYVTIAQISAPFGLRGSVKATVRTDFPDRFEQLEEVFIAPPGASGIVNWERKPLLSAKLQNEKVVVLRFEGLTKVEQVEGLRGYNVAVPFSETVPLPEGEYYVFQIIGLDVYSTADVFVGKIVNVERMPANDIYTIRGPLSKNDVLIPAIKDVVKEIDLDAGRMTIELLEGLI